MWTFSINEVELCVINNLVYTHLVNHGVFKNLRREKTLFRNQETFLQGCKIELMNYSSKNYIPNKK